MNTELQEPHPLLLRAEELLAFAQKLITCAREGHQVVNIAHSDDGDSYLCERCMTVYKEEKP